MSNVPNRVSYNTPNPGPILPIDDAEIAIDDIKSTPSNETTIAQILKINM